MHMHYFTIEQREALQAALNARSEELRRAPAEELEHDDCADLELREIERTLQRLHTPEFGLCAGCGVDIPFIRLRANPLAVRCIGCQTAFERSHAQPGHPSL